MDRSRTLSPEAAVHDVRRRVQRARNRFWGESVDCDVSTKTHRDLAVIALQYHDVLWEYRDGSDGDDWPDVSILREKLGKTVARRVTPDIANEPSQLEEQPAIQTVSTERIVQITKELDEKANQLGFGADVNAESGGQYV